MADFSEVWVEDIRQVHAQIAETEIIRFTRQDGATIWATCVILDILMPDNRVRNFTVYGFTESGERVETEFWECADDCPPEIVSLVPALISASESYRAPEAGHGVAPVHRCD